MNLPETFAPEHPMSSIAAEPTQSPPSTRYKPCQVLPVKAKL